MTLAQFADLAEVIGALGVVASLLFVGVQLRQNTLQMQRADANMIMQHGSALRHLLLNNRQTAELLVSGISDAPLDPVDELRVNAFFSEGMYILLHTWDRARSAGRPEVKDELVRVFPILAPALLSPRGRAWWAQARGTFWPKFVAEIEALAPALTEPVPSATASPAEGA